MSVKPTSWQAYQEVLRGGIADTQAKKVLQAIHYKPMTRSELSAALGISINAICGRVKELLDSEVIYVSDTRSCRITGRKAEQLETIKYE